MKLLSKKNIYLDYASATPIDKKVVKIMSLHEQKVFANPDSIHTAGIIAKNIIDTARTKIANLMHAHAGEIIFTGSGTESDALAILGVVRAYKGENIPHVVTTKIEHPAVLENCRLLEKNHEAEVTYVGVNEKGIVNPKDIKDALKENTILVSVMYANNEIGTIQPIQEIAKEIRHFRKVKLARTVLTSFEQYPIFHTDACQAMNYLPTENIEKLGVDMLSFNSSKIYGPKGIGIFYKKRGIELAPLYSGGGQESGLRSGTSDTISILGASVAFEETCRIKEKESARLIAIRDYGIEKLLQLSHVSLYEIILNGDSVNRLPNNINISIFGISSELLVIELDAKGIQVSAKSACKSDEPDESYVISALRDVQGIKRDTTDGSLRISLGRQTTKKDMDFLVTSLKSILSKYNKWK